MIHYVLAKLKPGCLDTARKQYIEETFQSMAGCVPGYRSVQVYYNVVERDSNMDLMIRIELDSADCLPGYLNHPIHKAYAEQMKPWVEKLVMFDHE